MRRIVTSRAFAATIALLAAVSMSTHVAAIDLILKIGDPAPALGAGVTIASFLEPPSTSDSGDVVFHVTVTGTGVTTSNDEVIYRWYGSSGFDLVAREGDAVSFASGMRTLTFLETPIVDDGGHVAFTSQLDDLKRGMVVWGFPGLPTLKPVVKVGETVTIRCEKTDGSPCTTPTASGALATMATFADRKGATFRSIGPDEHEILFRGSVGISGSPDSLWRWSGTDSGGVDTEVTSLAGGFEIADGTENGTYYQGFTDVAACNQLVGLVAVSNGAPLANFVFDPDGPPHTLLDRYYTIDTVLRDDLHCYGNHYSYLGGHSDAASDHDQTKRGVFIGTDQLYQATVTSSELPNHTIGAPLGQTLTRDDPPRSVFAANMIGTTYNGKAGVWRKAVGAPTTLLLYELQPLSDPPADVATIWAVHAGGTGVVAFHVLMNDSKQALLGYKNGSVFKIAAKGDTVPDGAGTKTIDSFWTLGGAFGSDPVVTGTGADGLTSALNARGEFFFLAYFTSGAGILKATIDLPDTIFLDGFEL
jgi:hypothetical protein